MSTAYRTGQRRREDDLTRLLLGNRQREREFEFEFEDEFEGEQFLNAPQLANAVRANRLLARRIGWGCVVGGRVVIQNAALNTRLGLAAGASEEDIARAVDTWQIANMGGRGDGQLGQRTWARMNIAPPGRFRQFRVPVTFNGRQLGVIEKTMPYREVREAARFGVDIEFAFRVTDIEAVRRAGFVDATGEDRFQWIQAFELRRVGSAANTEIQRLRRRSRGRIIDPTPPLLGGDTHPYYWDEEPGPPAEVDGFRNRPAQNGLCYDIIFEDRPRFLTAAALPGQRAYFNFETALVGIRQAGTTRRNVILNTVLWGFDIVLGTAGPVLSPAGIRSGPRGGSAGFKLVMNAERAAGNFPNHCFVGPGYARAATCA